MILTEPAVLVGLALLFVIGVFMAVVFTITDRPFCYVLGHPAPGSREMWPTTHNGHPATVWRCRRCDHLVTVVGSRDR